MLCVAVPEVCNELEANDFAVRPAKDFLPDSFAARCKQATLDWLRYLTDMPLGNNNTLLTCNVDGDCSYWWFLEDSFHRQWLKDAVEKTLVVRAVLAATEPGCLAFLDDGSQWTRLLYALGTEPGIRMVVEPARGSPQASRRRRPTRLALSLRELLRGLPGRLHGAGSTNPRLLIATMGREMAVTDAASGRTKSEDIALGPVIDLLCASQRYDLIHPYSFGEAAQLVMPRERRQDRCESFRPWEKYYLGRPRRVRRTMARRAERLARLIESLPRLGEARPHLIGPLPGLAEALATHIRDHLPGVAGDVAAAQQLIDRERPCAVLLADEITTRHKALVLAANRRRVPVVVVQHGVFSGDDYELNYRHGPDQLQAEPTRSLLFPTRHCIYGENSRDALLALGYPYPERLVITGQPRSDTLARAADIYDRKQFCERFKIDLQAKIVLVASQTFHAAGNRGEFFACIYANLIGQPDLKVVVKPHPAEDFAWHRQQAERWGGKALVMPREISLYQGLAVCDLLITFYSTAAIEAAYLGLPVITLNLTGQPDPMPFAAQGWALGVYRATDLLQSAREALYDENVRQGLTDNARRFMAKEMYRLDGKASRRVVEQLELVMADPGAQPPEGSGK